MNKTALRKILAQEGLLPRRLTANKDLGRMFADFYKKVEQDLGTSLDIRRGVKKDLDEGVHHMKYTLGAQDVDYDSSKGIFHSEEVEVASSGEFGGPDWSQLDESVQFPTIFFATTEIMVGPIVPFDESYLYESLYGAGVESNRELAKWKKVWDSFISKTMESKPFLEALKKSVVRHNEDHFWQRITSEAYDVISDQAKDSLDHSGSSISSFGCVEDYDCWDWSAEISAPSSRGAAKQYPFKMTGVYKEGIKDWAFEWEMDYGY